MGGELVLGGALLLFCLFVLLSFVRLLCRVVCVAVFGFGSVSRISPGEARQRYRHRCRRITKGTVGERRKETANRV